MRPLLRPRSRMLLKGAMRGVRGHYPLAHLRKAGHYPLTVEAERLVQHERIVLCPRCHSDASTFGSSQTIRRWSVKSLRYHAAGTEGPTIFRDIAIETQPFGEMASYVLTMHPAAARTIDEFWSLARLPKIDHLLRSGQGIQTGKPCVGRSERNASFDG